MPSLKGYDCDDLDLLAVRELVLDVVFCASNGSKSSNPKARESNGEPGGQRTAQTTLPIEGGKLTPIVRWQAHFHMFVIFLIEAD